MKSIRTYKTKQGKCPYREWLKTLDYSIQARVQKRLERVEQGNYGDFKVLDSEISELRFTFGAGYRIYFTEIQNEIVILFCGGDKSTQTNDIKKAKEFYQDYIERISDEN